MTGELVADESLTGADVRNGTLTGADIAQSTLDKPVMWAVVEANGALASSGQAGTSVNKVNIGSYSVRFPKSVAGCPGTATMFSVGGPDVYAPMGTITTIAADPRLPNNMGVVTLGANQVAADRRFSLIVAC